MLVGYCHQFYREPLTNKAFLRSWGGGGKEIVYCRMLKLHKLWSNRNGGNKTDSGVKTICQDWLFGHFSQIAGSLKFWNWENCEEYCCRWASCFLFLGDFTGLIFWLLLHLTKITSALKWCCWPWILAVEARLLEDLHLLLRLQPQRVDAGQPVVRWDLWGEGEGEGKGGG